MQTYPRIRLEGLKVKLTRGAVRGEENRSEPGQDKATNQQKPILALLKLNANA